MSNALANSLLLLNEIRGQLGQSKSSQFSQLNSKNKNSVNSIDATAYPINNKKPVIIILFLINLPNRLQITLIQTLKILFWKLMKSHYVWN